MDLYQLRDRSKRLARALKLGKNKIVLKIIQVWRTEVKMELLEWEQSAKTFKTHPHKAYRSASTVARKEENHLWMPVIFHQWCSACTANPCTHNAVWRQGQQRHMGSTTWPSVHKDWLDYCHCWAPNLPWTKANTEPQCSSVPWRAQLATQCQDNYTGTRWSWREHFVLTGTDAYCRFGVASHARCTYTNSTIHGMTRFH